MQLANTQTEVILKQLQDSHQHLTADELYERVKKFMPRISLATVYRNLETLSEAGIIGKLEISGRQKRFDADVHPHDHIFCLQCHRVDNIEFDRNLVNPAAVASDKGYRITGYRVEFVGVCPACQKKNRKVKERET